MGKHVVVRQLDLVVLGRDHNPTILNPDFLKTNQIVPSDWQLSESPICVHPLARVAFTNGVRITAQENRIVFGETFDLDGGGAVETPGVAQRYIETLPHVDYRAVGVNPKGHAAFESLEAAKQWHAAKFLRDGSWRTHDGTVADAEVSLRYELDPRTTLNLTVSVGQMTWKREDEIGELAVASFAANFHHDLPGDSTKERLNSALQAIEAWETDVETFKKIVNERILEDA